MTQTIGLRIRHMSNKGRTDSKEIGTQNLWPIVLGRISDRTMMAVVKTNGNHVCTDGSSLDEARAAIKYVPAIFARLFRMTMVEMGLAGFSLILHTKAPRWLFSAIWRALVIGREKKAASTHENRALADKIAMTAIANSNIKFPSHDL